MPVADTEVLFALSPKDPKHSLVLKRLRELTGVVAPDTAILEFQIVLRARGNKPAEVKVALLALHEALDRYGVKEAKTVNSSLLAFQCELEEKYGLSYFDSLMAASALTLDYKVISSDEVFDRVPELERISIAGFVSNSGYRRQR